MAEVMSEHSDMCYWERERENWQHQEGTLAKSFLCPYLSRDPWTELLKGQAGWLCYVAVPKAEINPEPELDLFLSKLFPIQS